MKLSPEKIDVFLWQQMKQSNIADVKKTFESLKDLQSRMMIIGKFVLAGCEAELAVISFLIRKNSENLLIAVLFYQVCADSRHCQSKAKHSRI